MRILLIVPKSNYPDPAPSRDLFGLGLPYLVGSLTSFGHEVHSVNLNWRWCKSSAREELFREVESTIMARLPDVIGIGGQSADYQFVKDAISACRTHAPHTPVVLGGGIITYDRSYIFDVLKPDFALSGEAELSFPSLLNCISGKSTVTSVANLSYWESGRPIHNEILHEISDLDGLPFPEYGPFDINTICNGFNRSDHWFTYGIGKPKILPLLLARSCPYKCTFCCHDNGPTYRQRSISNVLRELRYTRNNIDFNMLFVYDELFSKKQDRVTEFCDGIAEISKESGHPIVWTCVLRVTDVNERLLSMMKKAGCVFIGFGLESASPTVLKSMRKGVAISQIENAITQTEAEGIGVQGNFIFGDFAETPETMKETITFFSRKCRNHMVFLAPVAPYPGSAIFDRALSEGIISNRQDYYQQTGTMGKSRINMTIMSDNDYLFELNQVLSYTDPNKPRLLGVPETIMTLTGTDGVYSPDTSAPVSNWRFLYAAEGRCPHCSKSLSFDLPLRFSAQEERADKILICPHCNLRFLAVIQAPNTVVSSSKIDEFFLIQLGANQIAIHQDLGRIDIRLFRSGALSFLSAARVLLVLPNSGDPSSILAVYGYHAYPRLVSSNNNGFDLYSFRGEMVIVKQSTTPEKFFEVYGRLSCGLAVPEQAFIERTPEAAMRRIEALSESA